MLIKLLND